MSIEARDLWLKVTAAVIVFLSTVILAGVASGMYENRTRISVLETRFDAQQQSIEWRLTRIESKIDKLTEK